MDWVRENTFKNWLIAGLVALNLLSVSLLWIRTSASDDSMPKEQTGGRPSESVNLMKQALDLDDAQTRRVEAALAARREQSKQYSDRLAGLKKELAEELFKSHPDTALARSKAAEIGRLQSIVEMIRFDHFHELLAICTPEQREKLKPIIVEVFGRKPPKDDSSLRRPPQGRKDETPDRDTAARVAQDEHPSPPSGGDRSGPPSIDDKIAKYSQRLALTDEQVQKVRGILSASKDNNRSARKEGRRTNEDAQAMKERNRKDEDDRIMKILDERQQAEFSKMIMKRTTH
jgi:Spy/CpxP family protein refolding chaperone